MTINLLTVKKSDEKTMPAIKSKVLLAKSPDVSPAHSTCSSLSETSTSLEPDRNLEIFSVERTWFRHLPLPASPGLTSCWPAWRAAPSSGCRPPLRLVPCPCPRNSVAETDH